MRRSLRSPFRTASLALSGAYEPVRARRHIEIRGDGSASAAGAGRAGQPGCCLVATHRALAVTAGPGDVARWMVRRWIGGWCSGLGPAARLPAAAGRLGGRPDSGVTAPRSAGVTVEREPVAGSPRGLGDVAVRNRGRIMPRSPLYPGRDPTAGGRR